MKKYTPIMISLVLVVIAAVFAIKQKFSSSVERSPKAVSFYDIGSFAPKRNCAVLPSFVTKLGIKRPIIDLTQQRFKGIAILSANKILHPKKWERFEHFSTYSLDEKGNIYLAPMPYISIKPTTFNLQKNIYKLDSKSGEISVFMELADVNPSANNPFGIISLVYDCDDKTLWVSAIDETDYSKQRGVIYHIDTENKKILQRIEGIDALTLQLLHTEKGKYLLAGAARDNALYAYSIQKGTLDLEAIKLLSLPSPNEHIRKIKIKKYNMLELQTVPFAYTLIARATNHNRMHYRAYWNHKNMQWRLDK